MLSTNELAASLDGYNHNDKVLFIKQQLIFSRIYYFFVAYHNERGNESRLQKSFSLACELIHTDSQTQSRNDFLGGYSRRLFSSARLLLASLVLFENRVVIFL